MDTFYVSAASNAVGTLMVSYLVNPVERSLRYLFRFDKIVKELQEQTDKLAREQFRVLDELRDAKFLTQTQVIEKDVNNWLIKVEGVLDDVESLKLSIEENKRCFRWCPNWGWTYQLSKKIERRTLKVRDLVECSNFDINGHRAALPGIEFFKSSGYFASKSSTFAFNKIMEASKNDGVNMIGVCGMGGVGKTTLVREVGNKAKELQLVDHVILVIVSRSPNIGRIQDQIADFLELKFEKTTQEGKAEELWLRLKEEEKVLIILDDMWKELKLQEIGIPFGENHLGCTIILTTCSKRVCRHMGSQVLVSLDVLDEEEAWTLFRMNAGLGNASEDIIILAREVTKECCGLPLAIVTVARALRSTDPKGWESALHKLRRSKSMGFENSAYYCLNVSYDSLRSETTKRCFLLCALYPEEYSIDVEDLVRYAWGLRFYQNAGSIEEVRNEVIEAIKDLKDSCMLLEDDKKRYIKVNNLFRDFALWIASKEDNGLVTKPGVGSENESFKQKLKILLIDIYDIKTPIEYFEGMRELKVLSLSAFKSKGSFFSLNALKSLTNLRALQLEGFKQLEGISALAKLTNLEILSLHGSEFQESIDVLGELKNLRVLDIRQCKFLFRFPAKLIMRLVQIEELYLYDLIVKRSVFGVTTEEVCISTAILSELNSLPRLALLLLEVPSLNFPEGFMFPRLRRYEIAINTGWLEQPKEIISTRSLRISKRLPLNVISKLLWNVEFLGVSNIMEKDIKCLTDTTPGNVPVATILKNLKNVRIEECENLQVIFQMKAAENHELLLSKLEHLWLCELPSLEYMWKMPTQHVSLHSLEVVNLSSCGKLKSLFSFSLAQSLERLQLLKINGCGELKQIVEEVEGGEQELSPTMILDKSPCFPQLRTLEIYNCDSLNFFFPNSMVPQGLPQLKRLLMGNLCELKQIWRHTKQREENGVLQPQLLFFPSLTELEVDRCPQLTDLERIQLPEVKEALVIDKKVLSLHGIRSHNLIPELFGDGLNELTFLELRFCEYLEYLVDSTKEHVRNSALTNLVELSMGEMSGLKVLCNGQFPKGFLQNLKKLTVKRCYQLQGLLQLDIFYIMEENLALMSNLEHLELDSLPELRWILKGPAHYFDLQSLKVVIISRCEKLKSLFSPSLIQSMPQLEELRIESCYELKTLFAELVSNGEIELNSHHPLCLPRLRSLSIYECPRLDYVLPITLAQGLPQLESVLVSMSPQLKQVFGVATKHDGVEHCINLPRLKVLELHNLTNLSSFGPENYFLKAPALENLSVSASPQLKKFTIQQEVNNTWAHLEGESLFAFKEFLRNTKDLTLDRIMDQKNLIPDVDVDVEGLTSLKLKGCKDLECLADTTEEHVPTSGMFTNLVELVMENMIGLKMLCKGQPPKGFLLNLEMLTVERCMDIVSLSPVAQNLKKLTVEDCEKLQEIFRIDELLYRSEENQAPLLSNLDYLELASVPELRWILKGPTQYVSLRCLKVVKIINCNKLESLFSCSLIRSLRLLEELRISYCDKLKMVFMELESDDETELKMVFMELESDDETESNTLCLPNLKTLEIIECPSLNYVLPPPSAQSLTRPAEWPPGGYNFKSSLETMELGGLISLQNIWMDPAQVVVTNLRELRVFDCNRLTYIFPVMLVRNLPQLRILKICWCENLEQIIVNDDMSTSSSQGHYKDETGIKNEKEILFPQLQELWLERLPRLKSFSPVGYHLVFPSLDYLMIEDCSQMIRSSFVHAETKEPRLDETSPPKRDLYWRSHEATSLPTQVEEPDEISSLK